MWAEMTTGRRPVRLSDFPGYPCRGGSTFSLTIFSINNATWFLHPKSKASVSCLSNASMIASICNNICDNRGIPPPAHYASESSQPFIKAAVYFNHFLSTCCGDYGYGGRARTPPPFLPHRDKAMAPASVPLQSAFAEREYHFLPLPPTAARAPVGHEGAIHTKSRSQPRCCYSEIALAPRVSAATVPSITIACSGRKL